MTHDHDQLPFRDRRDAGRQLAAALDFLRPSSPVVLGLPRGGVPVAFEVAKALRAPLDILLVRKLGAPMAPELGLGAVVEGDPPQRILNTRLLHMIQPSSAYLAQEEERQLNEMARRRYRYRGTRERIDVRGRTVIVVDDGIATGSTMKAALQGLRNLGPEKLIFAVPVAARDTLESLCDDADDGICLLTPPHFRAVSLYYADFRQTSDEEVGALLASKEIQAADANRNVPSGAQSALPDEMKRGKPGPRGGDRR